MSGTDLAELKEARLLIAFTLRRKFCKCTTRGLQNPSGQRQLMQTRSRGISEGYSQMMCWVCWGWHLPPGWHPALWPWTQDGGLSGPPLPKSGWRNSQFPYRECGARVSGQSVGLVQEGGGRSRPGKVGKRGGKAEGAAEKSKQHQSGSGHWVVRPWI